MPKQALVFTCLQYKSFENTMGKGEIARNEQFLLFSQCFLSFYRTFLRFHQIWNCRLQPLLVLESLKFVVWQRVKHSSENIRVIYKTLLKNENMLVTRMFFTFPKMFQTFQKQIIWATMTFVVCKCFKLFILKRVSINSCKTPLFFPVIFTYSYVCQEGIFRYLLCVYFSLLACIELACLYNLPEVIYVMDSAVALLHSSFHRCTGLANEAVFNVQKMLYCHDFQIIALVGNC